MFCSLLVESLVVKSLVVKSLVVKSLVVKSLVVESLVFKFFSFRRWFPYVVKSAGPGAALRGYSETGEVQGGWGIRPPT